MYIKRRVVQVGGLTVLAAAALVALPATASLAMVEPVATSAGEESACELRLMPVPAGTLSSEVTGGDHTGRYLVGQATTSEGMRIGLRWINGAVSHLDTSVLVPSVEVRLTDINSKGDTVGYRMTDFSSFHTDAFVYRDGRLALLPGLKPTDTTKPAAINARGDIVGTSEDLTVDPAVSHAVLWSADRPGTVRELKVNGRAPNWVTGVDIDDDGTVLGFVGQRPTPQQRPYIWPEHGRGYPLTAPTGSAYPEGMAIHGGWVAGTAFDDSGNSVVVRWNLEAGTATVISSGFGVPTAVNRQGTVAAHNALLYRDGRVLTLAGFPAVLGDYATAAGSDSWFGNGNAVMWTGC